MIFVKVKQQSTVINQSHETRNTLDPILTHFLGWSTLERSNGECEWGPTVGIDLFQDPYLHVAI